MKTPKILLIASSFIITAVSQAQKLDADIRYSVAPAGNNIICYTPGNKLLLDDFKGVPAENSIPVAITSSGFAFKAGFRGSASKATLTITVFCNFDRDLSWMKANGKNDYVLRHEQHHFDITYLSTLAFVEKLKQANFTVANYQEKLQSIYSSAMEDMEHLQHQYDEETQNGQLREIQMAWNKRIDERLVEIAVK